MTFVRQVISGGQTGADQGGLLAAWERGITTGGFAPAGYRTTDGHSPLLEVLGLQPTAQENYQQRTRQNVEAADVTLLFGFDLRSAGSKQTFEEAKKLGKPVFRFQFSSGDIHNPCYVTLLERAAAFLLEHRPVTINVAGNRDLSGRSNHDLTRHFFGQLLDLVSEDDT